MLYGLEEFEYDEFGLMKKQKRISIKLILLVIVAILVCAFFAIFIGLTMKNDDTEIAKNEKEETNTVAAVEIIEKSPEEKKTLFSTAKKESDKPVYDGNHPNLPEHDMNKIKTKFVPQFNENGYNLVRDIYFSEEKQVFLTFDDGPSKDVTPQILDILKENDVKATFFVLGARVDLYPETLKRAFDEGHYIANHGYSHKYSKIYESKDTVFQEYVECENSIRNALNLPEYNSYLFRFPGGSSGGAYSKIKTEARDHFRSYGIAFTNWNCLTGDAEGKETKEECIQEVINTKGDKNSIILLMHDSNEKTQTVEALPEVIKIFKDEGYTFKTFYEIF